MKTIEQLLELSRNPYYTFTPVERTMLDDFLSKKQDSTSERSQEKSSSASSKKTNVTVRNIVKKADTYSPEAE